MRNERGVVLLVVMWALVVLMVVAIELGRTARVEGLSTDVYQQEVKTYYLALAGLNRALYQLVQTSQQGRTRDTRDDDRLGPRDRLNSDEENQEECPDPWLLGDGQWKDEPYGEGGYQVRVSDESGKININQVDEIILRQTFTNLDFDPDFGDALADAILDWRDPDALERLNGVESEYYLAQNIAYPAKDGPFDTIDELLLIRDVTQELFYNTLNNVFTVYGNARTGNMANVQTANALVLRAVQGIDAETADELVQQRQETCGQDFLDATAARGGLPTLVTIESVGYLHTGRITRRLAGVVHRTGGQYQMLRWQDRLPSPALPLRKDAFEDE